jgi:IS30 family transposase
LAALKEILVLPNIYILTITQDRGNEFDWVAGELRKMNKTVYLTDPYCSWEKASVENVNGIIRRVYPKGTEFERVEATDLINLQTNVNSFKRPNFGFKSANDMYNSEILKLKL